MKTLKDYPNHLQAYLYSRDLYPELTSGYLSVFAYMAKLTEIEPSALTFFYGGKIGIDAGIYAFYYPTLADDIELGEITGDEILYPYVLIPESPLVYDKPAAARWCGVGIRQIERWMAGNPDKAHEPLRHIRHGRDRFFLEVDLWDYMAKYAVGERWKAVTCYRDAQKWIEKFDGPRDAI